ncbi:MAG: RimK/LysX family protein, partial [Halomonas sp.]|nr:RimK/LysX family protein [Halomonas sp.]
SGALTSSIHAEDIERFERNDEEWVRFTLELEDEASDETVSERLERPVYRKLRVQGAGGEESRAVVLLEICLGETRYEEQFSLNDRDDMIYPILLGRRTIQHLGVIDVTSTFLHEPECDEDDAARTQEEQETDEDIGV